MSGVLLTKKDAFFTAAQFSQLLFNACSPWRPGAAAVAAGVVLGSGMPRAPRCKRSAHAALRPRPCVHPLTQHAPNPLPPGGAEDFDLSLPMPAILKPRPLWSGKQLLSAVVRHFARGAPPLTFSAGCKVPADYWGRCGARARAAPPPPRGAGGMLRPSPAGRWPECATHATTNNHTQPPTTHTHTPLTPPPSTNGEGEFVFRRGELLAGTLDKAQFGKFGLVHAMQVRRAIEYALCWCSLLPCRLSDLP